MRHFIQRHAPRLAAACAGAVLCMGSWAATYNNVVFFGDSLSDTGNAYVAGVPTGYAPLQYTDNTGNGLWVNTFAALASQAADATRSTAGGNNFAYGGARTGSNANAAGPLYLNQQVAAYLAGTGNTADGGSLYAILMGGNDLAAIITGASQSAGAAAFSTATGGGTPLQVQQAAQAAAASVIGSGVMAGMTSLANQVQALYGAGARNFLLFNAPDVLPTPLFQGQLASLPADQQGLLTLVGQSTVNAWNNAFLQTVANLSAGLAGEDIDTVDLNALGMKVLANQASYGFDGSSQACWQSPTNICADPSTRFFWDGFHPNSRMHSLLAAEAAAAVGIQAVPVPGTLALGLLALGLVARQQRQRRG